MTRIAPIWRQQSYQGLHRFQVSLWQLSASNLLTICDSSSGAKQPDSALLLLGLREHLHDHAQRRRDRVSRAYSLECPENEQRDTIAQESRSQRYRAEKHGA